MAKLHYGSPWALGAAGVGEGLLEGYMVGSDIQDRRRRRQMEEKHMEQERLREALSLLQTGMKSGDPAMMQAIAPLIQSAYPGFQVPKITPEHEKAWNMYEWAKGKGLPEQEAKQFGLGLKPGTEEKPVAFYNEEDAKYRGYFRPSQAPPGTTPKIWKPTPPVMPYAYDPTDPSTIPPMLPPGGRLVPTKPEPTTPEEKETPAQFQNRMNKALEMAGSSDAATKAMGHKILTEEFKFQEDTIPGFPSFFPVIPEKKILKPPAQMPQPPRPQPKVQTPAWQKGQGKVFEALPDPAQYKGKKFRDQKTGKRYQSNGTKWVSIE